MMTHMRVTLLASILNRPKKNSHSKQMFLCFLRRQTFYNLLVRLKQAADWTEFKFKSKF